MASNIFGGVADAISPPKLNRITYSPGLDAQINQLTLDQTANRAAQAAQAAKYGTAANAAAASVASLTPGDQAIIQNIINSQQNPLSTYQSVGNYNFGLLNNLSSGLADLGRAGDSRAQAALGYGGRGGSTYQSNSLLDRISKNLSPVYASTLGNIGRDASAISNNQLAQNNNTVGLLDYRAGIPGRSLSYLAAPIQLNQSLTDSQIQQLLGLGQATKQNTAGYQEKKSALGNIASSLDSAVDTGLAVYTGGLAGGNGTSTGKSSMFSGFGGRGATGGASGNGLGGLGSSGTPVNFGPSGYGNYGVSYGQPSAYPSSTPSFSGFGPSGYGNYGVGYSQPSAQAGAWAPSWN